MELFVSPFDTRKYTSFVLENGVEVLICCDPATEKSGASMSVGVGAMADPIPGTAHLLEHMLFVMSEKYPTLSEYQNFVSQRSGHTNAFTASESTTYFFEIPSPSFQEAFDRFAQFFVRPKFDPSAVGREIGAVASENTKNLHSDRWRLMQMMRSTAGDTPYRHFATGNEETLQVRPKASGIDVVRVVTSFHHEHYRPNNMKLAVYSNQPLDVMTKFVRETFSVIKKNEEDDNKKTAAVVKPSDPYPGPQDKGRLFKVVTLSEQYSVRVIWPLPEKHQDYVFGAMDYLSYILGHEGPGSLLALLKVKGWANGLVAGDFESTSSFALLGVEVDLTMDGMEHVDDVIALVFEYVSMLQRTGPSQELFNEIGVISKTAFLFEAKDSPSDCAMRWTQNMVSQRKKTHFLYGSRVMETFQPDRISSFVSMLTVDRCNIFVCAPDVKHVGDVLKEPWYLTEYSVAPIPDALKKRCQEALVNTPNAALHIPKKNEFIASNFDLCPSSDDQGFPELLCSDEFCQVWHLQDTSFRLPHAAVVTEVRSAVSYSSPEHAAMCGVLCRMIEDALKPISYDAELANLTFHIQNTTEGILITLSGFSHKLPVLLFKVLDVIEGAPESLVLDRFGAIREALLRNYLNFDISSDAFRRAMYYETLPVQTPRWTQDEYADVLKDLTLERFVRYVKEFRQSIFFKALIEGNINKKHAWSIIDRARRGLFGGTRARAMSKLAVSQIRRAVKLPLGRCIFDRHAGSPTDPNNAFRMTFQIGEENMQLYCLLQIFETLIGNEFSADLRGMQELGYVVLSFVRRELNVLNWAVVIQTDRRMVLAENMVDEFVATKVAKILEECNDEAFARSVDSLVTAHMQPFTNVAEQVQSHWTYVDDFSFDFGRKRAVAQFLLQRTISLEHVKQFYKTYIAPRGAARRVLLARVHAGKESKPQSKKGLEELKEAPPVPLDHDVNITLIQDLGEFRRIRPLYPGKTCQKL